MRPTTETGTARLHYLDWLRLAAILSVFILHCAKVFDFHTETVVNADHSLTLMVIREFFLMWVMPLFFVISGAAIYQSLRSRSARAFIKERAVRILVPLVLVGTFVIAPVYVYVEKLFDGKTTEGFFHWYPHFFEGMYPGGNFAPIGFGNHLWYLLFLFVFTLVLLPLFTRREKTGTSRLAAWSRHLDRPWAILLLFVPIGLASALFESVGLDDVRITGSWDFLSYMFFFVSGYAIFANRQALTSVRKYAFWTTGAAAALTVFYLGTRYGMGGVIPGLTSHDMSGGQVAELSQNTYAAVGMQFLRGLIGWLWVIGLVGLGQRFLRRESRVLKYSNEAILPFYILHHAVIYVVAYYVIQWDLGIAWKFLTLLAIALSATLAIYELFIRHFNATRFLFGMKTKGEIWGLARLAPLGQSAAREEQPSGQIQPSEASDV